MKINYRSWGLGDKTKAALICQPQNEHVELDKFQFANILYLNNMKLQVNAAVNYYQGKNNNSLNLRLSRFSDHDASNSIIDGEHVSLLLDSKQNKLFGLMQLTYKTLSPTCVSHQTALTKAAEFLKIVALDLVPNESEIPIIKSHKPGVRLDFSKPLMLGNIQIHWIGSHEEIIIQSGKEVIIAGMKVKAYNPQTGLWLWVIVGGAGQIITYERDVYWNFSKFRRDTQMWLHSKWLLEHCIF